MKHSCDSDFIPDYLNRAYVIRPAKTVNNCRCHEDVIMPEGHHRVLWGEILGNIENQADIAEFIRKEVQDYIDRKLQFFCCCDGCGDTQEPEPEPEPEPELSIANFQFASDQYVGQGKNVAKTISTSYNKPDTLYNSKACFNLTIEVELKENSTSDYEILYTGTSKLVIQSVNKITTVGNKTYYEFNIKYTTSGTLNEQIRFQIRNTKTGLTVDTIYATISGTVKQEAVIDPDPVSEIWMYTGNTATKPTSTEILSGTKYDYNITKSFNSAKMTAKTIWVCLPSSVTLVSMENASFSGDFIYNTETGKNLLSTETVTINNKTYTLYYLTGIATKVEYKTTVR